MQYIKNNREIAAHLMQPYAERKHSRCLINNVTMRDDKIGSLLQK